MSDSSSDFDQDAVDEAVRILQPQIDALKEQGVAGFDIAGVPREMNQVFANGSSAKYVLESITDADGTVTTF